MSSFGELIRRASKLWTHFEGEKNGKPLANDGEIIYSKNNVCVHQTTAEGFFTHTPGYLSIRVHHYEALCSDDVEHTLILSWISNSTLRRNPRSVENNTPCNTPCKRYTSQSPSSESVRSWSAKNSRRHSFTSIVSSEDATRGSEVRPEDITAALSSIFSDSDYISISSCNESGNGSKPSISLSQEGHISPHDSPTCSNISGSVKSKNSLEIKNSESIFWFQDFDNLSKCSRSQTPSGYTSGRISPASTPNHELYGRQISCQNASLKGIFCVDLKQMKSLRLFFSSVIDSNNDYTNGQLVIASRESQYKIFHFHTGGLDKLASVLEEWDFLTLPNKSRKSFSERFIHFSVCKPQIKAEECHPEENSYVKIDSKIWKEGILNEWGQIEDDFNLRKIIFFAGIDEGIRSEVWPFLLRRFDYSSTFEERKFSIIQKEIEYKEIDAKRRAMSDEEREVFWRNVECIVEKDVPRTDRSNPFFAGENNENVEVMKRILLNYAFYNPSMGYTQGMSDLLAPLLSEIKNEFETFWCFVGLMQRTLFVSSPKDVDMDSNLSLLRELIRLMLPDFYKHLKCLPDALELLFAHRWILLCFKREFPEREVLKIWESCWAHYQTDYFHLFICLSIISIYGIDVLQHDMKADEILLHFSTLTMHMNGDLVLRKARGLLYQFRLLPKISCTLVKICDLCGPGIWDSGYVPAIECVRNLTEKDDFQRCTCFGD
ncbi:TBC1 domain family member 16-like isoform X5, partial [Dinothrombium tinctorium]